MITYSIIQKSQLEGAHRIDAEYYQPDYLVYQKRLELLHAINLVDLTRKIDVGFVSSMVSHFHENGIMLLRTQNVKPFIVDIEDDLVFIDEEFHNKLKKSQIRAGQVLLARSGSIGDAAIVPQDFPIANSADIILIETKDTLLPEFLTAFLNSRYGKSQIERGSSGGLQGHINLFSLEMLKVPKIGLDQQDVIKEVVLKAIHTAEDSKLYYQKAENLLLEELELKDFRVKESLSWIVNLSEVEKAHRIDAEYFQPKYKNLIEKLQNQNTKKLGEIVSMKKGFEPGSEAYKDNGKLFIRVSSLSKFDIEEEDQKYLSDDFYQKLKKDFQPQIGEVLLTKDATPGIAFVVKEQIEGIISGGITRLKLREAIDPEYLTICINSIIGKWQAEHDAGGSIIAHWKPEQIANLLIPILPIEIQQQIADLVRKSHDTRKRSKELLEEAKRKVEEMIESASSLQVERGVEN